MARARFIFALALAALSWSAPARAVLPDEMLPDPALEARARGLSRDLRILVRDRVKAGDDDKQVLDFLTARYGDFVLLKPRFSWETAALWGTPAALLLLGGLGLFVFLRRRAPAAATAGLTATEQARVEEILRS